MERPKKHQQRLELVKIARLLARRNRRGVWALDLMLLLTDVKFPKMGWRRSKSALTLTGRGCSGES
jgi:hypothetical protein